MWRSSLWSISWLRHQMFYPYVTISAAQAHESDDLRHAMSPFSPFLSSFSGAQRILGYVRPRRIEAMHRPKTGKRRSICGLHLEEPLDWDSLYAVLWCNLPSNAPPKDADPELKHSKGFSKGLAFEDLKGRVLGRTQRHSICLSLTDQIYTCWTFWYDALTSRSDLQSRAGVT